MSTPTSAASNASALAVDPNVSKGEGNSFKPESLGLLRLDTNEAIETVRQGILLTMYTYPSVINPTLTNQQKAKNEKVRKIYEMWNPGAKWEDDQEGVIPSVMLLGDPGHGKTTAIKEASRQVAEAMGLNYVENPPDEYTVTDKDFLFVSHEFSGENSKLSLVGIPAREKDDQNQIEYLKQLLNKRIGQLAVAGGSTLLLDDFTNASLTLQNIGLSISEEKRFQGLNIRSSYVAMTGNLGSIDGTNTSKMSSALRNRVEIYYTQDTVEHWLARERPKYLDDIGMVGLDGFVERCPQYFSGLPNIKMMGGYPSPRSLSKSVVEVRRAVRRAGGDGCELKALPAITRKLSSFLGLEAGQAAKAYLQSLMSNAEPLARALMQDGKIDEEEIKKRFDTGLSANQQYFGYQFSTALADHLLRKVVRDDGRLEEAITNFGRGVVHLDMSMYRFAVERMKLKLNYAVEGTQDGLKLADKKAIIEIIGRTKGFKKEHADLLIDALVDADKYELTSSLRKRRKAGVTVAVPPAGP